MKIWTLLLYVFIFTPLFGQIKITDVGDGWKGKIEQALDTIQKYDIEKYLSFNINNIIDKKF